MRRQPAFTLIELLVVVAIIALLISIVMPSLSAVRRISKKTACQHNLHAIGLGMEAYLLSHRDTFPYIARMPTLEPEEDRRPAMPEALKKEMAGRSDVYRCPADRNEDDSTLPPGSYYDAQGTSYEWNEYLEGKRIGFKGRLWLLQDLVPWNASELWMMRDFERFHGRKLPKSQNNLYADLHIEAG